MHGWAWRGGDNQNNKRNKNPAAHKLWAGFDLWNSFGGCAFFFLQIGGDSGRKSPNFTRLNPSRRHGACLRGRLCHHTEFPRQQDRRAVGSISREPSNERNCNQQPTAYPRRYRAVVSCPCPWELLKARFASRVEQDLARAEERHTVQNAPPEGVR